MDRIIKPGAGPGGGHFRPHQFMPIKETVASPGDALSAAACESFKKGLVRRENRCPTISEMEARLSSGNPDSRPGPGLANGLEAESSDPLKEQQAVACMLERFSEALQDLSKERDAIYEHAAEETVKLALAISEKVINHEVRVDPGMMLSLVRKAVQKIKESQPIRIKIHPMDFEALKQAGLDTPGLESTCKGFAFQADAALGRGDCLVETRQGHIDAGIHHQLALIEEAFASLGSIS